MVSIGIAKSPWQSSDSEKIFFLNALLGRRFSVRLLLIWSNRKVWTLSCFQNWHSNEACSFVIIYEASKASRNPRGPGFKEAENNNFSASLMVPG